jgi:tRNA(Ile2)-agmatinylcytidine synthase
MWGTARNLDHSSVIEMDRKFRETFNNYDYENRHICIAPSSPCPVLFGIRGDTPNRLPGAMETIRCGEKIGRWFIFETNHGTDDHLQRKKLGSINGYDCVITDGTVCQPPRNIEGGHTIFRISDSTGEMDCAAYEPSKQFRNTIRKLCPGDTVTVYGGVRDEPRTINVEKIKVRSLAEVRVKTANPLCKTCGKRMKSMGKGAGYRCIICGKRTGPGAAETKLLKRDIKPGFYEPPPSARRHISKPIKRMKR